MAYPRFQRSRQHKKVNAVTGAVAINTADAWADLTTYVASLTDITLSECQVGDTVLVTFSALWANEAFTGRLDVASAPGGTIVRHLGSGVLAADAGIKAAHGVSGATSPFNLLFPYVLAADDLSGGVARFRLRVRTNGAKTLDHGSNAPWWALNLGPAQE